MRGAELIFLREFQCFLWGGVGQGEMGPEARGGLTSMCTPCIWGGLETCMALASHPTVLVNELSSWPFYAL